MKVIEPPTTEEPIGRELTGWELHWHRLRGWWIMNVWRRVPRLVWVGQEIDVGVTFSQDPMCETSPIEGLFSGGLYEIEKQLNHMGVKFDSGQGCHGRDWEWDWSLDGPISVRFRGRCKRPERRRAQPQPMLKLVS